ncbi:hypothetical protein QUF80_19315 [Desulfococcaceae bacterium HSG8]|nr:hypothetical protein [Desulfococcaceae bacterium HSG8]
MKPIYFPFTYISEPVAEILASCFRQTVIYQPSSRKIPDIMRKWEDAGIIDIRVPVTGDEEKLDAIIRDYRNWANLHQGNDLSLFKIRAGAVPFFEEMPSQIRDDIRRGGETKASPEKPDPLFNARIFLCIAQEFDMQNREINNDLASFEKMEQELMKNLKGEDLQSGIQHSDLGFPADDPGNYMPEERLKAWGYLMGHDLEKSDIFVTASRSVFESLTDNAPDPLKILHTAPIPVYKTKDGEKPDKLGIWQDNLMEQLDMFLRNTGSDESRVETWDGESERKVSLTFHLMQEAPDEFFSSCPEQEVFLKRKENSGGTLLGLIEF